MTPGEILLRPMTEKDWERVAEIYSQGIATGHATFEQEVPAWEEWNNSHLKTCRIIAEIAGEIVGWAALTAVSRRSVYAGVAAVSVYVSNKQMGQGIGTKILEMLISESEKEGIWTLQASIFPENKASLKIHENLGFRQVGYREKIGKMNSTWRDTILMERRSKTIGFS